LSILIFAVIGAGIGVGLSFWEPDDPKSKVVCIQWLGLIGDMFIRALKCFVLPLVFVNGTLLSLLLLHFCVVFVVVVVGSNTPILGLCRSSGFAFVLCSQSSSPSLR
jgi:hypothetical protein